MTYTISKTKEIRIHHSEDNWYFFFTVDEYGTVNVATIEGHDRNFEIDIPNDCITHFISALQEMRND